MEPWPRGVQHFWLEKAMARAADARHLTKASLWVHLPKSGAFDAGAGDEEEAEDATDDEDGQHAWINLYYVSVDKKGHVFLTQEAAVKVRM